MSYWDRHLALAWRLQAALLQRGTPLGASRPLGLIAELLARADAVDPGHDVAPATEGRPVTLGEWLRGIRAIDGETPLAAAWVQPTMTENAVRLGEYRSHGGVNWRSLIDYNTTEPGSDPRGWMQEDPELDPEHEGEPVVVVPWAPDMVLVGDNDPSRGAGNGDRVSYGGRIYRTIQGHTTQAGWTPNAVPALFVDEGPAP